MAIQTYTAVQGQSIFDICLNTYGSLDFLFKLVSDNNFGSINTIPYGGQAFTFDTAYIVDQVISQGFKQTKLATLQSPGPVATNDTTQALLLINQRYATANIAGAQNIVTVKNMYQSTQADAYTAGTNGETAISFLSWIGWTILQVTKEIQPLKTSQYSWNANSGQLNLTSGLSLAQGETIYILVQKLITP